MRSSYGAWVEALGALVAGAGAATPVTADMAADLNRILDSLVAGGSPALARAIVMHSTIFSHDTSRCSGAGPPAGFHTGRARVSIRRILYRRR